MNANLNFQPRLSPRFITYVREYLHDHAIDPSPLFKQCHLSPNDDAELADTLPIGSVCQLFSTVAAHTNNPNFGIDLSKGYHFESGSIIIFAMMAAPTVRVGLETLHKYDKYVDSAIETSLDLNGKECGFELNLLANMSDNVEQLNEYLLAFLLVALRKATRKDMPIRRVEFTHKTNKDTRKIESFFGSQISYGSRRTLLLFDSEFLDSPLHTANALLFEILCDALRRYYATIGTHYDFMQVVNREVLQQFKTTVPTINSVARNLQISDRTLRRRLANLGTKLQEVKNEARTQRAKFYLEHTTISLTEIAYELGFSELSAFSRAFKAWNGATPQSYRDATSASFLP